MTRDVVAILALNGMQISRGLSWWLFLTCCAAIGCAVGLAEALDKRAARRPVPAKCRAER